MPASAIRPTTATNEREFPVNHKAESAPTIPKGMTLNTIIVLLKVLNSRSKIPINRKIVSMIIMVNPLNDSCLVSYSPPSEKYSQKVVKIDPFYP